MSKNLSLIILLATLSSCSAEKINFSPVSDWFKNKGGTEAAKNSGSQLDTAATISYSSEISDLISSFPRLGNTAIDHEADRLKASLNEYLYATKSYNQKRKENAYFELQKSYSKLQRNSKYLNPDEKATLDRYLTRIKSSLASLENQATESKDSVTYN